MSPTTHRLRTGETVTLPLDVGGSVVGAALPAPLDRLRAALPAGLAPVPVAPGRGAVVLAGVRYDDVGPLAPYDEFAVIVPAVAGRSLPARLAALPGSLGGYVHALPVSTDAGVALGDLWGFPKRRADVRVGVGVGNDVPTGTPRVVGRGVRLRVPRSGPSLSLGRRSARAYTERDGALVRTRIDLSGVGVRPPARIGLDLGDGPLARAIGRLGIELGGDGSEDGEAERPTGDAPPADGQWALARFDGRFAARLHPGLPIGGD